MLSLLMDFLTKLQSATILKTNLFHTNEAKVFVSSYNKICFYIKTFKNNKLEEEILNSLDLDNIEFNQLPYIHLSIIYNNIEALNLLLEYGADTEIRDKAHNTPLHTSIKLKKYNFISKLLSFNSSITLKNNENLSPLDIAKKHDDKIINDLILNKKRFSNVNPFISIQSKDVSEFFNSIKNINIYNIKDSQGLNLLHYSILYSNYNVMVYLLNKDISIDSEDYEYNSALCLAAKSNNLQLDMLIKRGATLDHKNIFMQTALFIALNSGNYVGAKILIDAGANINMGDGINTPLSLVHLAIFKLENVQEEYRDLEILLLSKGASVDDNTNALGLSALMQNISKKQTTHVKKHFDELIELGADVNIKDKNGRTALMLASSVSKIEIVKKLVNNYADLNIQDNFGWTALMLASYYSQYETCRFLLEIDCDTELTTHTGLTALDIAKKHGKSSIVMLLEHNKLF